MNQHHYKVIFDSDFQRSVVVSKLAKSRSKPVSNVCLGDVVMFSERTIGGSVQKVRSEFEMFCEVKNT